MKTEEIRNDIDPSKDLPLDNRSPNLTPISAAMESEIISINQEVMARPLEKNKELQKNPSIMALIPLNLLVSLASSSLIRLQNILLTIFCNHILFVRNISKYKTIEVTKNNNVTIMVFDKKNRYNAGMAIALRWKSLRFFSKSKFIFSIFYESLI